jgi:thioesterase-3
LKVTYEIQKHKIEIKEIHLDTFGHVNNAVYLQILEQVRWDLITSRGYGFKKIQETGLGPVILEIQMKFLKEIKLRETITVETQTLEYGSKIGILRQDIFNEKGDKMFESKFTFGFFDTKLRKLVTPTPEWLYAIGARSKL